MKVEAFTFPNLALLGGQLPSVSIHSRYAKRIQTFTERQRDIFLVED